MKRLKWAWVLFCTMALLAFCGCSYRELDEQIQGTVQQVGGTEDQTYKENPPMPEDQIEYKGIGETFSAYKKYTVNIDGFSSDNEKGNEGLTYTLKGATAYASIDDADVDPYCVLMDSEILLKNNAFVLIDIQASYTVPEGGKEEIIASADELSGMALESKLTPQSEAAEGLWPSQIMYFSLCPKEDDPILDPRHQACCYIIQDGESIDFQVGFLCAQEFIDDKNVFLEVNAVPSLDEGYTATGDTTRKLFVLFPEGKE